MTLSERHFELLNKTFNNWTVLDVIYNDNSTKAASTAYVDRKVVAYNFANATATVANGNTYYFGGFQAETHETTANRRFIPLVNGGTFGVQ